MAERKIRYQAVCSVIQEEGRSYFTYGLQCLSSQEDAWVEMDVIEDISPERDAVVSMAGQFNSLRLSPLHFRDVVRDCIER